MNAQQTTSLVNLISAQPAKPSSSGQSDDSAPRFSEVLGNQRTQQGKPVQNTPSSSSGATSKPEPEASKTAESSASGNNAQAAQTNSNPDGTNSGSSATTTPANAGAQAAVEPPADNATAVAMSDLAAAVAQVFLNRSAQSSIAPADTTDATESKPSGVRPGFDIDLADASRTGKGGTELTMQKAPGANSVADDVLMKPASDTTVQHVRNPASEAAQGTLISAQASDEPRNTRPQATVASLNQRANALDREARLNAGARDMLAGQVSPRLSGDNTTANTLFQQVETRVDTPLSNTRSPLPGTLAPTDAQQPLPVANALAESSLAATPASLNFNPGSVTAPMVSTPLGHPQWGNDFSQQVAGIGQSLKNGLQTIEMRLDPPDLGPIRISLSMNDGVAQALFVSPHANVRNAVENALPQLQHQLAQAGISLGQTSVSDQGQTQQQAADQSQNSGKSNNSLASTGVVAENALPAPESRAQSAHNGQINTFA